MDMGIKGNGVGIKIDSEQASRTIKSLDRVLEKKEWNLKDLSKLMDNTSEKINETKRKKHTDRLFLNLLKNYNDNDELQDIKSNLVGTYANPDDKDFTLFDDLKESLNNKITNAESKLKMLYNTKRLAQEEYDRLQNTLDDFSKEEVG